MGLLSWIKNLLTNKDIIIAKDDVNLVEMINNERIINHLPKLTNSLTISNNTKLWAEYMAKNDKMIHSNLSKNYPTSFAAENVAMGNSPAIVMQSWLNSLPHKQNILGDYLYLGVSYATSATGQTYYCANFVR